LQPKRWLTFNYAYQMVQAALTGQGVVLGRTPLIAEHLASGELVEPLKNLPSGQSSRIDSPHAYWLIVGPRAAGRPEIQAFCNWLREQAQTTREGMGEVADASD
jgi:DNA-binding transcriptional LysR family regulator